MKDKLGGQIMKEYVGLRLKTCNYLKDNNDEDKRQCVIRENLIFKIPKTFSNQLKLKIKQAIQKKNETEGHSFKEIHKKIIKNNKLILFYTSNL